MPVPLAVRAVDRVLVALEPGRSEEDGSSRSSRSPRGAISSAERTVLAGEVLASWFGASLQLVTTDGVDVSQLERLSGTIGLPTDPVLVLPTPGFARQLDEHAARHAPCLVVAAASAATLSFARTSNQPTFLVAPGPTRRQPSGRLLVELNDDHDGGDALALATVWAQALDVPIALVPAGGPDGEPGAEQARARLEAMGVAAMVAGGSDAVATAFAGPDAPMALVVPAARLAPTSASSHTEAALAAGGNVLVAPAAPVPHRPSLDLESLHELSTALGSTSDDSDGLDAAACAAVLAAAPIGRLAYVEQGWPVVVPVNFSIHGGDIFIRSMRGGKLDAALRHDRVCFEADTFVPAERTGQSVIVHGHLELISDPATLRTAWANEPSPWVDNDQMLWLRLIALATTGRRVG